MKSCAGPPAYAICSHGTGLGHCHTTCTTDTHTPFLVSTQLSLPLDTALLEHVPWVPFKCVFSMLCPGLWMDLTVIKLYASSKDSLKTLLIKKNQWALRAFSYWVNWDSDLFIISPMIIWSNRAYGDTGCFMTVAQLPSPDVLHRGSWTCYARTMLSPCSTPSVITCSK